MPLVRRRDSPLSPTSYWPLACREFEIGEQDCRDARRLAGIADP